VLVREICNPADITTVYSKLNLLVIQRFWWLFYLQASKPLKIKYSTRETAVQIELAGCCCFGQVGLVVL
jgi:hypothetical protein